MLTRELDLDSLDDRDGSSRLRAYPCVCLVRVSLRKAPRCGTAVCVQQERGYRVVGRRARFREFLAIIPVLVPTPIPSPFTSELTHILVNPTHLI